MCQEGDKNIELINRDHIGLYVDGRVDPFPETLMGLSPHLDNVKIG